jgi:hypothetical protein
MHSNDNPPDDKASKEVGAEPTSSTTPRPLRREAMLIATERQRGALLAAVCSLAGVGLGFGLSQMAATNSNCYHSVSSTHYRAPAPAQATVIPHTMDAPVIAKYTWLGVEGHTFLTEDSISGAAVTGVFPGSPAAAAGLQPGVIITGVEGTPVVSFPGLIAAIRSHEKGDQVTLNYGRDVEGVVQTGHGTSQTEVILGDISQAQFDEMERGRYRRR